MIAQAVKQGRLVTVVVLIICVLGFAAAVRMPVQMIPNLETRVIVVQTGWPGATPQDIEKEILLEQERYLRALPNLTRMESFAFMGGARIILEFPFGIDVSEALIRVSNALSQVPRYPENVDQPRLFSESFSENAFMYFAVMPEAGNPRQLDMDMLTDFIDDNVRPRMERVPGVSQVNVNGGALQQIQIIVDSAKLAQRELTMSDVGGAIRSRNRDVSAGDINAGKRRYLVRTTGRFSSVESLESLILAFRDDSFIRLGDVADVRLDHYESRSEAIVNGERSISLSVKRQQGSNVVDIKSAMLKEIELIQRDLLAPNGLQMTLIGDDVRYVQASINNVFFNLCLGAILATAMMYLFLRSSRATMICLLGIPVCTVAAFISLTSFGRTINVISLAGIAFAIGMTLDNSIVVLESIEQARRKGMDRIAAAVSGVREVWTAVVAASATTVLVFAPVLFVTQEAGQLYSDIAIAISGAIIASMAFALFAVPAATTAFSGPLSSGSSSERERSILKVVYALCASPKRRYLSIALTSLASLGLAILFMPPAEYLPEGEEPKAFTRMIAPPGYNLQEMQTISSELRVELNEAMAADSATYDPKSQTLPPLKYYFMRAGTGSLWLMSEPKNGEHIDLMMQQLTERFEQYPGMRAFSARGSIISSNQGGTRAVELNIVGPDQGALYSVAREAMREAGELFESPRLNSSPSSLSLDQPLIEIQPRWERLSEYGFNAEQFGFTVAAYSDGAFIGEFIDGDDKIDMFLFGNGGNRQSLEQLANAPILTPIGSVQPLSALADIRETVDSQELRRVNGRRTVSVYMIPAENVALETAVERVRAELIPNLRRGGYLPENVTLSISGAADSLAATRSALLSNFTVAVLLIYLLLVAVFAHWGYPLLIMLTVPMAMAGGLVGLVVTNLWAALLNTLGVGGTHQSFDMITMLGFVILLGTVVNNPILIVEQARRYFYQQHLSAMEAVQQALASRLRPILLTTTTTLFGLAPLVLLSGAGTELYRGVGIVVICGLLASMLVTLSLLPCLLVEVLRRLERRD